MTTIICRSIASLAVALPIMLTGCGASESAEPGSGSDVSLGEVKRVLSAGDEGADVRAVYGYLRRFGYFPNSELSVRYPHWTPLVDRVPKDPAFFGPELTRAVRAFQNVAGISPNGVVDDATLDAMLQERCGNPDHEFAAPDPDGLVEKWNHLPDVNFYPAGSPITWIRRPCEKPVGTVVPCPAYAAGSPELLAFSLLAAETNLTFRQLSSCGSGCTPGIEVRFFDNDSVPPGWSSFGDNVLGYGIKMAGNTAQLSVNTAANWTDLRVARHMVHEIGHILGLAHSSIGPLASGRNPTTSVIVNSSTNFEQRSVMWFTIPADPGPVCPSSGDCWHLTLDDRQSLISRCELGVHPPTNCYSSWTGMPGLATDIAVGGTSPVGPITWVTSGSNTVWRRGVSNFIQDPGVTGISIAVTSAGVPWVVTPSNLVSRRSNATCNPNAQGQCPGSWASIPGQSARDIAIGGSMDSTWIVTNQASGSNFVVLPWNGSNFFTPSNGITAVRVTVDSKGFPWVVKANGTIWTSAATNGSAVWTQVTPDASCAKDIGAGRNGGVYAIGCVPQGNDFDVWIFDKQTRSSVGSDETVTTWRPLSGAAKRIAVGPDARPYVVQASGFTFNLEGI
jgi:hypothetical protein